MLTKQEKKLKKVRARIKRNRYKKNAMNNLIKVSDKFYTDNDIVKMRSPYPEVRRTYIHYFRNFSRFLKRLISIILMETGKPPKKCFSGWKNSNSNQMGQL